MSTPRRPSVYAFKFVTAMALALAFALPSPESRGEERKFGVMLAHSPKSWNSGGAPGLPPGGLPNINDFRRDYFDRDNPDIDTFVDYWEEISYGDVVITGDVFNWVTLPWPFELDGPNQQPRTSPVDFINLHPNRGSPCDGAPFGVPDPYAYGAGEEFCDCFSTFDNTTEIAIGDCGKIIITDLVGGRVGMPPPTRDAGMDDFPVSGQSVWTPGERFIDEDGDNRWDGIDEYNDQYCHGPDGCRGACNKFICSISREPCPGGRGDCPFGEACVPNFISVCEFTLLAPEPTECQTNNDCAFFDVCVRVPTGSDLPCDLPEGARCPAGETCGDPLGSGPRGCLTPGCGDLDMPSVNWDDSDNLQNCDGSHHVPDGCTLPELVPCTSDNDCEPPGGGTGTGTCVTRGTGPCEPPDCEGFCAPANCAVPTVDDGCGIQLPPCCVNPNEPEDCIEGVPGVTCVRDGDDVLICCAFDDFDRSGGDLNQVEPFEDYLVRYEPSGASSPGVWRPVMLDYIRDNYPGDVEALIARTGNGYYDAPDLYYDIDNTKMMQDAGSQQFAWSTPKPGTFYRAPHPANEEPWFDDSWRDRYGTEPPPWPGGEGPFFVPPRNSPAMRPFDPAAPTPPSAAPEANRRWFQPNRGGFENLGDWLNRATIVPLSTGSDNFALGDVLPEEEFDYYDGWVEHDDLPSSKYHSQGDKRLGEITSPRSDEVTIAGVTYTGIFGQDIGAHIPGAIETPDFIGVAAGPYAKNIHGEKGFDAGDVCITEWLTWRRDGLHVTPGYQWELDNQYGHAFAGELGKFWRKRCSDDPFITCGFTDTCPEGAGDCTARRCRFRRNRPCTSDDDCGANDVCVEEPAFGFRDYNLDGMIDQGEVRPARSESYSVDSNPFTSNNGTVSDYPFNRQRMVEDVVEALDSNNDWDDFRDPNGMAAAVCAGNSSRTTAIDPVNFDLTDPFGFQPDETKTIQAEGFVSGIVIVPGGSYNDDDLFPFAPSFYPIHNEDADSFLTGFPDWPADSGRLCLGTNTACATDSDCFGIGVSSCTPGRCDGHDTGCGTDLDCPGVEECVWNRCPVSREACDPSLDCELNVCQFNRCVVSRAGCNTDTDCCDPGADHCPVNECKGVCTESGDPCVSDANCVGDDNVCGRRTCAASGDPCNTDDDCSANTCRGRTHRNFSLFFHDLVICSDCRSPSPSVIPYAAHEYLHSWERYPDLYDYDVFADGDRGEPVDEENCPIGVWDIMSNRGSLVHPAPILKEGIGTCSGWIKTIDLATVLTPGVETTITLPPVELVRDGYFFLENEERIGERYYLWSAGLGFDARLPGSGMLIQHTDVGANPEALPLQQRSSPFTYLIVQADGRGDLEACSSPGGNDGDAGDIWPGSTGATTFNFNTTPSATWYAQDSWIGLDISDIRPDGAGSVSVTLTWTPTNVPSLRFLQPPGGDSVSGVYQVRFEATDVRGGTLIEVYYTDNPDNTQIGSEGVVKITERQKVVPGTVPLSINWNVTNVPDGRYFLFAKLIPGPGADGQSERSFSRPRAGRNNGGDGILTVTNVDVGAADNNARSETWTLELVNIEADGTQDWVVNGTVTQPSPEEGTFPPDNRPCAEREDPFPHLCLNPSDQPNGAAYTSIDGEVTFRLKQCSAGLPGCPQDSATFEIGDVWSFVTTGITSVSQAVTVAAGGVTAAPTARINASPLSGLAPLEVTFDGGDSTDPNGEPLTYFWTFGDGIATDTGVVVTHEYTRNGDFTAVLRVTNASGRFNEVPVDILVLNNPPFAIISQALPTASSDPVLVEFKASDSHDQETPPEELIYQWDFGDGSGANDQGDPGLSFRETEHFYRNRADGTPCTTEDPCTFTVTLTVTDNGGLPGFKQDTATVLIRIGNVDPVAVVTASPQQGVAPLAVTFDASGSTDADGDALTVDWDFGDGETATGTDTDPLLTVTHTYTTDGSYSATAVVRDGEGGTANWPGVTITVDPVPTAPPVPPNRRPVVEIEVTPSSEQAVGETFTFDASGSTDPDGDTITFAWDFGDDESDTGESVTHEYDAAGTFTVRLTVSDSNATTQAAVTVSVTAIEVNRPPVAVIGSGPRTASAPATLTFDGRGSFDLDGDPLQYEWEFELNDVLIESMDDSIVTRIFDTIGTYTVRLTVKDGRGGEDSVETDPVRITAQATPPAPPAPPEPEPEQEIRDSAEQRPSGRVCGLGMILPMFASLGVLGLARRSRRRVRRSG